MRSKLVLIAISSALAGCTAGMADLPDRGLSAVNVPVVTTADYVFDAAAPGGRLAPGEAEGLGYGDSIYVDGDAYAARNQVAAMAGNYGMMIQAGAPVTAGMVQPGSVRVVVSRRRAVVPNCPNWSVPAQPNYGNRSMSNFGCGVNANLAAQIANPEDLLHGQEGSAVADAMTGAKAVIFYRTSPPTGEKGLQDISTKKKDSQ
jgi:pilus assembly protein CpaD